MPTRCLPSNVATKVHASRPGLVLGLALALALVGPALAGQPVFRGAGPGVATLAPPAPPAVVAGPPLLLDYDGGLPGEVVAGTQVDAAVYASGGVPPYRELAGSLDPGLGAQFDPLSGNVYLYGVPRQGAGAPITFTIADSSGRTATLVTPAFVVDPSGPYRATPPTATASDPYAGYGTPFALSQLSGPTALVAPPGGTASATYSSQVSGDVSSNPTWVAYGTQGVTDADAGAITADGPLTTTFTFAGPGVYAVTALAEYDDGPYGYQYASSGGLLVTVTSPDGGPLVAASTPPAILDYPPQRAPGRQCFPDGAFLTGGLGPFTYTLTSSDGTVAIDRTQQPGGGFCVGTTGGVVSGDGGSAGAIVTIAVTDSLGRTGSTTVATRSGYPPLFPPQLTAGSLEGTANADLHLVGPGIRGGAQPLSGVTLSVTGDTYGITFGVASDNSRTTVTGTIDQAALLAVGGNATIPCAFSGFDALHRPFSVPATCVVGVSTP